MVSIKPRHYQSSHSINSFISLPYLNSIYPHISHLPYPTQLKHLVHPSHPASQSPDPAPQETPSWPSPSLPPNPCAQLHVHLCPPCARCCIALAISLFSFSPPSQPATNVLKLTPCQPLHCSLAHYVYRLAGPCPGLHAVYRCRRGPFWFLSSCLGRWGTGLRGWRLRG